MEKKSKIACSLNLFNKVGKIFCIFTAFFVYVCIYICIVPHQETILHLFEILIWPVWLLAVVWVFNEFVNNKEESEVRDKNDDTDSLEDNELFIKLIRSKQKFFQDMYSYSIQESREIYNRTMSQTTHLVIIIGLAHTYIFCNFKKFYGIDPNRSIIWDILFLSCLMLTSIFLIFSIYCVIRSLKNEWLQPYIYYTASMAEDVYDLVKKGVEDNCNGKDTNEIAQIIPLLEEKIDIKLIKKDIKHATINRKMNQKRFDYLSKATLFIIITYIPLMISYIIYYCL